MSHVAAKHYDEKLGFVSEYGRQVVELLHPQPGERVLDIGCGTGDLTNQIARLGASVVGIDVSERMVEQARRKYPDLSFRVGDAQDFSTSETFDAVFSNAALHWMQNPTAVIQSVWKALKAGGRFVAEFGGKGNVQRVVDALTIALREQGVDSTERNPWFFPSIGEYATLLEGQGFRVTYAEHFDRPTAMVDGELGIEHWLNGFAEDFLVGFAEADRQNIIHRVMELTKPHLFMDGQWVIDYKRIRVAAVKPS
ncbi:MULTISPECIES: class I SAM-dependent methyltransferase [Alicyclobacillus]|uniref:Methyltransferase domain-containing protein n=1 Tax=Alicyclobacillus acidoterrestris (strain ATCC 49025 / DSM 3922 / CIP 106132 / NCIMB 13137 / GD3B) TaxID=1356854 RepID=A0A9E7D1G8_ALIAG|nr:MULTISPECIES: class I SAM-dependent methyltransferase [Alicyclobacillus]UNO50902.1 methyltransferase domain-containing protein [Alicyclobacillus acidoterrestris]